MTGVSLRTRHLLLRPWLAEDAEALFDILREKDILRYFPNPNPPVRGKVDAYITRQLTHWSEYGFGHWAVVIPEDGRVVGWNGLEYLPELGEIEVAYLLSCRVWGRGYATEAACAALRFGFGTVGLKKIIGLVHPENIGSIRVLEKCGLSLENRIILWGLEMCRYQVDYSAFDADS